MDEETEQLIHRRLDRLEDVATTVLQHYALLLAAARAVVAAWDDWTDEPWNPEEPHWANFAVTIDVLRAALEERGAE